VLPGCTSEKARVQTVGVGVGVAEGTITVDVPVGAGVAELPTGVCVGRGVLVGLLLGVEVDILVGVRVGVLAGVPVGVLVAHWPWPVQCSVSVCQLPPVLYCSTAQTSSPPPVTP